MKEQMIAISDLRDFLASPQLATTQLEDGSAVLLDIDGHQVLSLNETGMFLVGLLREGAADIQTLVQGLKVEFDVDSGSAANDVERFLADFSALIQQSRDTGRPS